MFERLTQALYQFGFFRALEGGAYAQLVDGHWVPVYILMVCKDGTRVLKIDDGQPAGSSFHESQCLKVVGLPKTHEPE
jgi:hypothetical protein